MTTCQTCKESWEHKNPNPFDMTDCPDCGRYQPKEPAKPVTIDFLPLFGYTITIQPIQYSPNG